MTRKAGESSTSPRRLIALERERQAFEYRKQGAQYWQIAQKLGYSQDSAAYKAVIAYIKRLHLEPATEARQMLLSELETHKLFLFNKLKEQPEEWRHIIELLLKLSERYARIAGIEQVQYHDNRQIAIQLNVNFTDNWSDADITDYTVDTIASSDGSSNGNIKKPE